MHIDARGLGCPKPLLLAKEALDKIEEGKIEILVDSEASLMNLERFSKKMGYGFFSEREEGYHRVIIKKEGVSKKEKEGEREKDLLLVITSHTIGEDKELGKVLMKAFLETLLLYDPPDRIFFMNTGVRLTTVEEEFSEKIKELESLGVEIYTCGTCLRYLDLEEKLKVGKIGGMNIPVEGIKEFKKVVWIG